MAAASGSSIPKAVLNLIMVSTSSPLRSSFPVGKIDDTYLKCLKKHHATTIPLFFLKDVDHMHQLVLRRLTTI